MFPKNSQTNLTPNDAKASLGIATHLQDMLMPKGQPQGPPAQDPAQGAPSNQTTPEDTKAQMDGLESRLMDELQTLRAEMKTQGDGKQELADLKKQIETILNSSD